MSNLAEYKNIWVYIETECGKTEKCRLRAAECGKTSC